MEDPRASDGLRPVRGDELYRAVQDVLDREAERARALAHVEGPALRPFPWFRWLLVVLLLPVGVVLATSPPSWLAPSPPPPLPAPFLEAGLRLEVYHAALAVEGYREREGRLPAFLGEAGEPFSELRYQRLDARTYRLEGRADALRVVYVSTEPLESFLATAADVVRGGRP